MLFEILDDKTKERYNILLKNNNGFKDLDLQTRVLMAQLEEVRYYDTWKEMLEQSLLDTMSRIEYNFLELFRGYSLRAMLPSPNTEEKIIDLFLANFTNVVVHSKWDEEGINLKEYLERIKNKYYIFLITIHANTSDEVRPGIVESFAEYIKAFESTMSSDMTKYEDKIEKLISNI